MSLIDFDKIRTWVGDTNEADPLLTDNELEYALAEGGTIKGAAALAAEWISAKFARQADKSVGDLSISYSQRAQQYAALAVRLRGRTARVVLPYFGGISQSAKDAREADTDRVKPAFTTTMLDDPATSAASDDDADADVS